MIVTNGGSVFSTSGIESEIESGSDENEVPDSKVGSEDSGGPVVSNDILEFGAPTSNDHHDLSRCQSLTDRLLGSVASRISSTQLFVNHAAELPLRSLKYVKNALAQRVHHELLAVVATDDRAQLTIQGGGAPGTLSNALLRHQGVGRYLGGEISVSSEEAQLLFSNNCGVRVGFHDLETNRMMNHFAGRWREINDLPSETIVGFNGTLTDIGSTVHTYISERGGEYTGATHQIPAAHERTRVDRWRATQIVATIAALHHLGMWTDRLSGRKQFGQMLVGDLNQSTFASAQPESYRDVKAVKRENDVIFRNTMRVLRSVRHVGISVGESFTGGALTSLLHSVPGAGRYFDTSVVWYNAQFKAAFGVEDNKLNASRIAEPETVVAAARGLLAAAVPRVTSSAISTSGWANRQGHNLADFFSVAAISHKGPSSSRVSARVSVESTASDPLSYRRGELTRNLGVTASLLVFNRSLMDLYPESQAILAVKKARNLLDRFAETDLTVG